MHIYGVKPCIYRLFTDSRLYKLEFYTDILRIFCFCVLPEQPQSVPQFGLVENERERR
jgi:hypothetical protein